MKRDYRNAFLLTMMLLATTFISFAQDDLFEPEKGFKKENLFTGGNGIASFASGFTVLGINPVLGYTFNDYFDAGGVLNFVYTGARDYQFVNDKFRQYNFGAGAFARAHLAFMFAQIQPEFNVITQKHIVGAQKYTASAGVPSLLLGGGYTAGREKGGNTFFYMSVMVDVLKNEKSPYVSNIQGRVRMEPVVRAGVNIGLYQFRKRRLLNYY